MDIVMAGIFGHILPSAPLECLTSLQGSADLATSLTPCLRLCPVEISGGTVSESRPGNLLPAGAALSWGTGSKPGRSEYVLAAANRTNDPRPVPSKEDAHFTDVETKAQRG